MKLSTTTALCKRRPEGPKLSMEESVKWIREAGFEAADANFFYAADEPDTPLLREDWEAWAQATRALYEANGLPFDQAHGPAYNYVYPGEDMNPHLRRLIDRSLDVCQALGVGQVVFHPVTVPDAVGADVSMEANLALFRPLLDSAGARGLSIAIENMFDCTHYVGDHGGKLDPRLMRTDAIIRSRRRFGSSLEELLALVDTLRETHKNVGICWDTGHANESGTPQAKALEKIGSRLIALHINDNYAVYDDHNIPFHGTIDCWGDIMAALKRIGYKGHLTYETGKFVKHVPTPLLKDALAYSAKVGRYLISLYDQA